MGAALAEKAVNGHEHVDGGPTRTPQAGQTDRWVLLGMIPHHEDALSMGNLALTHSGNPQIRKLAGQIITDQTRETVQDQQWLKTVGAEQTGL